MPEVLGIGSIFQGLTGLGHQSLEDFFGKPLPGVAVRPGVLRWHLLAEGRAVGDHPADRLTAGRVGIEDLSEKGPEGHRWGEDSLAEDRPHRGHGLIDDVLGKNLLESEPHLGYDSLAQPSDVSSDRREGSHAPPFREGVVANLSSQTRRRFSITDCQERSCALTERHSA